MMQKQDIKDVMSDFSPKAPESMWKSVSSKLAEESMTDVSERMGNFHPDTDISNWSMINRRLVIDRFLTFHVRQFNLYYLLLLLIFISGTAMLASPHNEEQLYTPQNRSHLASYYIPPANNNNIIESVNTSQLSPGNTAQEKPGDFVSETGNALAGPPVSPDRNRFAGQLQDSRDNQDIYPDVFENPSGTNNFSSTANKVNYVSLSRMPGLKLFPFTPFITKLAIKNFSPLPDTLGYDAFGAPILADSSHWSLSLSFSGNSPLNQYQIENNPELLIQNQSPASIFNNQEKPLTGYSADLNLDYIKNHLVLSTGVGYQEIKGKFNSNVPTTFIDSVQIWEPFTNYGWDYDTTYYLNIDTLLITGDSIYTPYLDSTWAPFSDSLQVMVYDSTPGQKFLNNQSIVRYINIPVWVGYREQFNKWEIQAQLGLITSIPVYKQTSWYNPELNEIVYNRNAPLNNILLTGAFRTYIARRLNDNWLIGVEPSYYCRLNSLFEKDYPMKGNQHLFRLGVRVQYQF